MKAKNLFTQNKISITKLGLELLVVFLGVSAGFLLQNNKEIKADRDLEIKYLEGVMVDTKENIKELNESIESDSLWLDQNKYALPLLASNSLPYDSAQSLILSMAFFSEFNAQTNTYTNITNSGKLNIIEDYNLRQMIVDSYNNFSNFKLLEVYFRKHNENNFIPYLISNYNMFTREFISKNTPKLYAFKNIFAIHYSITQQRLDAYKSLLEENLLLEAKLTQTNPDH